MASARPSSAIWSAPATLPVVGVITAIVMRRFDIVHFQDTLSFLAVPLRYSVLGFHS